ncbi:MAG: S-methyl-5'-thioinosine phosphorylase [Granulosicoccaceae bacterium]|jgi:5'-methylthioinosine phosphorylase
MSRIAIIGGTGLTSFRTLKIEHREVVRTPYGDPSAPLTFGTISDTDVVFLARHGYGHTISPHRVNYRANMWALKSLGVEKVVAVAAVGGIRSDLVPASIAFPDQIIDYTYSRDHTFFDDSEGGVTHIDFTQPYCEAVRDVMIKAAREAGHQISEHATYGATQGPRLESAAEIDRLEGDGCDMVGMTGMPEAALARELDLCYATCAVVANMAAGRGEGVITMKIVDENLKAGMVKARQLLESVVPLL